MHIPKNLQKMNDINIARGHSPNFSPSRSNGNSISFSSNYENTNYNFTFVNVMFFVCVSFTYFAAQLDVQTLHVYLPNHGFKTIRFDEASNVRQVINLIIGSMSPGQSPNPQSYALRLRHILTREVCILFNALIIFHLHSYI